MRKNRLKYVGFFFLFFMAIYFILNHTRKKVYNTIHSTFSNQDTVNKFIIQRHEEVFHGDIKKSVSSTYFNQNQIKRRETYKLKNNLQADSKWNSKVTWLKDVEPLYKLNSKKLLIPSLYNGPNNQMLGFQQSIFLAIMLNRTLVLPWFYAHSYNNTYQPTLIRAEERFNVDVLRKLVTVVSMETARKICKDKFDAFFQTSHFPKIQTLLKTHLETGIRGLNYQPYISITNLTKFVTTFNQNPAKFLISNSSKWLTGKVYIGDRHNEKYNADIKKSFKIYQTEERCALYCCPFRQLGLRAKNQVPENWPKNKKSIIRNPWKNVITKTDAEVLMNEISYYTPPINIVLQIQQNFCDNVLMERDEGRYLAVHWRYDEADFMRYLCVDHVTSRRKQLCKTVARLFNPVAFATALISKLSSLHKAGQMVDAIYVAAPNTLKKFINQTQRAFYNLTLNKAIKVYSGEDLQRFIENNEKYGSKVWNKDFLQDKISLVEMEICRQSDVFVWSKFSTWSERTLQMRLKENDSGEHLIKLMLRTLEISDRL